MNELEIVEDDLLTRHITDQPILQGPMSLSSLRARVEERECVWGRTWNGVFRHILTRKQPLQRATFGVSLCGGRFTWLPCLGKDREAMSPCIKCMRILIPEFGEPNA